MALFAVCAQPQDLVDQAIKELNLAFSVRLVIIAVTADSHTNATL